MDLQTTDVDTQQEVAPQEETQNLNKSLDSKEQQDLVDLDSLEKFKFEGREWSRKELRDAYLMQSDYTKKMQALAEQRKQFESSSGDMKFYNNLQSDLDTVKSNPNLVDQFKKIYPEKFHRFLNTGTNETQKQASNVSPEVEELRKQVQEIKSTYEEQKIQAIEAELDVKFTKLTEKYPYADTEAAISRAQALIDKNVTVDDKVWDDIFKTVHERNMKLADKYYSDKINKQKQANTAGKDSAAGGGIPSQAPKKARNIKEATNDALEYMAAQN